MNKYKLSRKLKFLLEARKRAKLKHIQNIDNQIEQTNLALYALENPN